MAIKFKVEASQYISAGDFIVFINADFDFLSQIPCSVVLYLIDGIQCAGMLAGGRFWPVEDQPDAWGLVVTSEEILNPKNTSIVSLEIQHPKNL
jgi:hypothetical protein